MVMFDRFPILEGKNHNYTYYFALITMLIMFAFSLFFYILSYIMKSIEKYITRKIIMGKSDNKESQDSINYVDEENYDKKSKNEIFLTGRIKEKKKNDDFMDPVERKQLFGNEFYRKSLKIKVFFWLAYVFELLSIIFLSFTPISWSAFNLFPIPATIFIMLFIYYIRFYLDIHEFLGARPRQPGNWLVSKLRYFLRMNILAFKNFLIFYIIAHVLIIFFSIFLPFLFENSCVSLRNPHIGFKFGDYDLSTKLTRSVSESKKCPPGKPCHIYITLPSNMTSAAFVNVHTATDHDSIEIRYSNTSYFNQTQKFSHNAFVQVHNPEFETIGARLVHTGLLTDLTADQEYTIGIFYDNKYQVLQQYTTLSDKLTKTKNITIIQGGDVGYTDKSRQLTNNIIEQNPNLIMIGGDIAYDNGMATCYHTWDNFLGMMDRLNNGLHKLVPIIFAVGNHDLGLNSLSEAKIYEGDKTPLYFQFFPQHFDIDENGTEIMKIPDVDRRRTYFLHTFANVAIFSLDSGFKEIYRGKQLDWMYKQMDFYEDYIKIVQYHVPTFSSCIEDDHDKTNDMEAIMFWNAAFDKFNVLTVFENHNHLRKRTFRLKRNAINEDGTVFLGDGLWGGDSKFCGDNLEDPFFASLGQENHVWVTNITANLMTHSALSLNKSIIDSESRILY